MFWNVTVWSADGVLECHGLRALILGSRKQSRLRGKGVLNQGPTLRLKACPSLIICKDSTLTLHTFFAQRLLQLSEFLKMSILHGGAENLGLRLIVPLK